MLRHHPFVSSKSFKPDNHCCLPSPRPTPGLHRQECLCHGAAPIPEIRSRPVRPRSAVAVRAERRRMNRMNSLAGQAGTVIGSDRGIGTYPGPKFGLTTLVYRKLLECALRAGCPGSQGIFYPCRSGKSEVYDRFPVRGHPARREAGIERLDRVAFAPGEP